MAIADNPETLRAYAQAYQAAESKGAPNPGACADRYLQGLEQGAELFASADPVEDLERWADDGGAVPAESKPGRGRQLLEAIGKAHHGGYFTGSEQR